MLPRSLIACFVGLGSLALSAGCALRGASGAEAFDGVHDPVGADTAEIGSGRVGSHGMVLAGTPVEAFLSHIPMFQLPHDVQLLVAGSFTSLDGTPIPSLPSSFSDELFTFLPDRLSLDALRTGSLMEMRGTIFLGNFENGGRPLSPRVRFVVSRVLHQHILDGNAASPSEGLPYFLIGSHERTFAVHRLAGAPGFDEVVRVVLDGDTPSDAELRVGVEAKIAGGADTPSERLGLRTEPVVAKVGEKSFSVKSVTPLSCLDGPDFASPCR